ncbi:NADP-dependent oxidoreductase domain-containing protein [Mycena floridula]|nr:NADP-dependent oxidoreductase domain-containing protein [Mycena floridula]
MPWDTVMLNDGWTMPTIAFGTSDLGNDERTVLCIDQAMSIGFSNIDTSQAYCNEREAGIAMRESGLAREDVFITAKYSGLDGLDIKTSITNSLENLWVTYLDLYLIDYPRLARLDIATVWEEMEDLKKRGLVRSIGVCNFGVDNLASLVASAKVKPAVNQIALHPYVYAQKAPIIEYAAKHGIVIEAYNTLIPITKRLAGPVDVPVDAIATRLNVIADQVLLAWAKAKGAVVVTSSSKKRRLEGYLNAGDIKLTDAEVAAIDLAGALGARQERFERNCIVAVSLFLLVLFVLDPFEFVVVVVSLTSFVSISLYLLVFLYYCWCIVSGRLFPAPSKTHSSNSYWRTVIDALR